MEKSTTIIDAQTSLLRELRETYVALRGTESSGYVVRVRNERDSQLGETMAAILRSIEKLALAVLLPRDDDGWTTQQIEPPAAEICKVTHDVVRIRNERNGAPGWENHAAAFCGISPKMAIEVWNAAVAKAVARPIITEVKLTETDTLKYPSDAKTAKPKLAIGQTWRTRSGEVGVIENKSNSRYFCRFGPDRVRSYDAEGNYGTIISGLDLTELISDGGAPPTE